MHHEWKQFVENRVTVIRSLVPPDHSPGVENPADIPLRGMSASALSASSLWLSGPDWLWLPAGVNETEDSSVTEILEVCQKDIKHKDLVNSIVSNSTVEMISDLSQVVNPEKIQLTSMSL